MTATIHKLSAGDGFTYYLRQTAAHDASERGCSTLADYYSVKGESPGVWMGSGLSGFEAINAEDEVTEKQMRALFGLGRHPDAEAIEDRVFAEQLAVGAKRKDARRAAMAASQLGQPFRIYHRASEFRRNCAEEYTTYNLRQAVRWNTPIPDDVRAEIRTRVAREMFVAELGREPANEAELSGWVARNSRNATTAVSGFDVCFSPPKSVSLLWALAPAPVAERVEAAHRAAVADALAFLETHAAYTRLGANGVAQVDTHGLIATAFEHRESRALDPDLHTHLVVSGKVQTREGGLWRALDARMMYRFLVSASEVYNTSLELHGHDLVGLEFADRDDGPPDRPPVREIVGVNEELRRLWSRRDTQIQVRLGVLATEFQRRWGREPTTVEMWKLAQIASRDTRPGKHDPRSRAEQRDAWWREAVDCLGGESAVAAMVWAMCNPAAVRRPEITPEWVAAAADRVIVAVSLRRSVWQANHIHAETQRLLRGQIVEQQWQTVLDAVILAALAVPRSISRTRPDVFNEPEPLRRADGVSVFTVAESRQYTSAAVLISEQKILAAARRTGGRTISEPSVDVALLEYAANNDGRMLTAGQAALVREFARRDEQRPYLLAARDAHSDWIAADREATHWKTRVDELTRRIDQSGSSPDIDELEHLLADIPDQERQQQFAAQLADLRQPDITADIVELHVARICSESARTAAEHAKAIADTTREALLAFAGTEGVVDSGDVDLARLTAMSLDYAELNQARFRLAWKEGQLLRNGIGRANLPQPPEAQDTADAATASAPSPLLPESSAKCANSTPRLFVLTSVELEDHIRDLHTHLALTDATDAVLFGWVGADSHSLDGAIARHRTAAEKARKQELLTAAKVEQQRRQELSADQLAAEERQRQQSQTSRIAPLTPDSVNDYGADMDGPGP